MAGGGPYSCILLTGASSGIGAALAESYAAAGVRLVLIGRNAQRLNNVATTCQARGAEVEPLLLDLADRAALAAAIARADAQKPFDLVIANAGVSSGTQPDGNLETWDAARRVLDINIFGTFDTLAPTIEVMRQRHRGQVAIVGSLAAWRGLPASPAYSASKAAIETWGEALRGALEAEGIGVTVISPGYVTSPMSARLEGAKPFEISAERAARLMRKAIDRNRARLSFPFPLNVGTWLLSNLPDWAARRILPFFAFTVRPDGP